MFQHIQVDETVNKIIKKNILSLNMKNTLWQTTNKKPAYSRF